MRAACVASIWPRSTIWSRNGRSPPVSALRAIEAEVAALVGGAARYGFQRGQSADRPSPVPCGDAMTVLPVGLARQVHQIVVVPRRVERLGHHANGSSFPEPQQRPNAELRFMTCDAAARQSAQIVQRALPFTGRGQLLSQAGELIEQRGVIAQERREFVLLDVAGSRIDGLVERAAQELLLGVQHRRGVAGRTKTPRRPAVRACEGAPDCGRNRRRVPVSIRGLSDWRQARRPQRCG